MFFHLSVWLPESLHKVFKWLGFDIETQRDCKAEKMLSIMKELAGRNHSHVECLVCFILSHGQEGSVYGVEGRTVTYRELMEPFSGFNCSSLAEKPKLFFIQACQGTKEQRAVHIQADGSLVQNDAVVAKDSIPSDADFLLGMATVASFISFRERTSGTWFIQSLCKNLIDMVPRLVNCRSCKIRSVQHFFFYCDSTTQQHIKPSKKLQCLHSNQLTITW